jgi:hypothetical protein
MPIQFPLRQAVVPWPSTSKAPVPKCNGYLGIVVPERKAKVAVQAIHGRCLKCGCRLAWVLVRGRTSAELTGSDPVWAGYIETLARPGGNVTAHAARKREMGYEKGEKARGLLGDLTSHWSYQLLGAEICRGSAAVAGSCSCLERSSKPIALTSRRTSRPFS